MALYEVAEMIVDSMAMPALCEELQLHGPVPLFGRTTFSHGSITHLLRELDDEGKGHMLRLGVMNKGRVNHPLNSGNRPGRQVGSERNCLIDQGDAMLGTHHPLNIGRRCRNAAHFGMNSGLSQHFHQSPVRKRVQFWIAEDIQPLRQIRNRDFLFARQRIIYTHTCDERITGDLLHNPVAAFNRQWQQCSIERALLQPLKHVRGITSCEVNRAIRKTCVIGIAQMLQQSRIDEGGIAKSQGRHVARVNSAGQRNNFGAARKRFLCVGDNHLPGWRHANAIALPYEDREPDLVFNVFDLLAQGGLGHVEAFRGPRNVSLFGHHGDVLQMPELHEIMHGLGLQCATNKKQGSKSFIHLEVDLISSFHDKGL